MIQTVSAVKDGPGLGGDANYHQILRVCTSERFAHSTG